MLLWLRNLRSRGSEIIFFISGQIPAQYEAVISIQAEPVIAVRDEETISIQSDSTVSI